MDEVKQHCCRWKIEQTETKSENFVVPAKINKIYCLCGKVVKYKLASELNERVA